jgi:GNAT superfamily N-acetyltransferase
MTSPGPGVHLAQLNVGRLRQPLDHPDIADFVAGLAPVNALADASPGFVWRLQTEEGDATALRVFPDPQVIVNMSVWASVDALKDFMYRSAHTPFLRRRAEWFDRLDTPSVVLWWIPAGHQPDIGEARSRLDFLILHGPSPYAFGLRAPKPPLVLERRSPSEADAASLISDLDAELLQRYPEPGGTFFDLDDREVDDGRGTFLVARLDGRPVGCGALRVLEGEWPERTAELKRMYVRPDGRGRRIGAAVLDALLDDARRLGVRRVVLETGRRQHEALALYQRAGFAECPCWGAYAEGPLSVCLGRSVD